MCAHYEVNDAVLAGFSQLKLPLQWTGFRQAWPKYQMPIIRLNEAGEQILEFRGWGFIRRWPGKSGKLVTHVLNNAKGEEVSEKKSFKSAFKIARCLIPLSAWFEWSDMDGVKRNYRLTMKNKPYFAAGGLYEVSKDPKTELPIETFTMVTIAPGANSPIEKVHQRAPFLLSEEDYDHWLDPSFQFPQALISPYPRQDQLIAAPVVEHADDKQ